MARATIRSATGALATSPERGHLVRKARGNVRSWHETDMPTALRNVRYQGQSGKHLLSLSFSGFDPISDIGWDFSRGVGRPRPEFLATPEKAPARCMLGRWQRNRCSRASLPPLACNGTGPR